MPQIATPSTGPRPIFGGGGGRTGGRLAQRREDKRHPTQTSTTSVQLTPEQQRLLDLGIPNIEGFVQNPPTVPAAPVAPFNPTQIEAQQTALGGVPTQQDILSGAAGASTMLTSPDILDPSSNPALAAWQAAATRPLVSTFLEDILPSIRTEAIGAGQLGSSRAGVAQGIASDRLLRNIGDVNASIANQGYSQGLQSMLQALGLAPGTAAAQNIPAATIGAVGDVQQGQTQRELESATQAQWMNALLPYLLGQDLIGLSGAIPGGTTTSTTVGPRQYPFLNFLGTALGGLGAFAGSRAPAPVPA